MVSKSSIGASVVDYSTNRRFACVLLYGRSSGLNDKSKTTHKLTTIQKKGKRNGK